MGACSGSQKKQQFDQKDGIRTKDQPKLKRDINIDFLQNGLVFEYSQKIQKDYQLATTLLGKGAYGEVKSAVHKVNGLERAIKVFIKEQIGKIIKEQQSNEEHVITEAQVKEQWNMIQNELDILKKLDHPFIMKTFQAYDEDENYYLVSELLKGGELFTKIHDERILTEKEAALFTYQLLSAIIYLHKKNIVHRDLKPENLIFETNKKDIVKLIDFGTSTLFDPSSHSKMKAIVGSATYTGPEVSDANNAGYTEKCDIWSSGMILYVMLTGENPFYKEGQDDLQKLENTKTVIIPYKTEVFSKYSKKVENLLKSMLQIDETQRLSAKESISHGWFQEQLQLDQYQKNQASILQKMIQFTKPNQISYTLKYYFICYILQTEITFDIRTEFIELSTDRSGIITPEDLIQKLQTILHYDLNKAETESTTIFNKLYKVNKQKSISYTDYLVMIFDIQKHLVKDNEKLLKSYFYYLNGDGLQQLNFSQLIEQFSGFNSSYDQTYLKNLLHKENIDILTYDDFKTIMKDIK